MSISVTKNIQGAYVLSTIHDGHLVQRTYFGYSLSEAKRMFKEELK